MPRERDIRVAGAGSRTGPQYRSKRPPLFKSSGCCCLMLDPHCFGMYLGDEGNYVCKAFSPRCYVIQKVGIASVRTLIAPPPPFCCSFLINSALENSILILMTMPIRIVFLSLLSSYCSLPCMICHSRRCGIVTVRFIVVVVGRSRLRCCCGIRMSSVIGRDVFLLFCARVPESSDESR